MSSAPIELPGGSRVTEALALGDVDGDGWIDVVVGNSGYTRIQSLAPAGYRGDRGLATNQLLRNDGAGGFEPAVELPGGDIDTMALVLGDIDGDGWLDVVIGNEDTPNQLLRNDGAGGFESAVELPGGSQYTYSLALGDIDEDGWLDVVIGNEGNPSQLLRNDGAGGFEPAVDLPGNSECSVAIAIGDLDRDGWRDLVIGNQIPPNQLLRNNGAGGFEHVLELNRDARFITEALALGDVDGDGFLDLVVAYSGGPNQLLRNDGAGGFEPSVELLGGNEYTMALALGDVDGDGLLDVIVGAAATSGSSYGPNLLLRNNGVGGFEPPVKLLGVSKSPISAEWTEAEATYRLALGNINQNGRLDVLIGNIFVNLLLRNNGAGGFETSELPGGRQSTSSLALADVDGNGWLDVVMVNADSPNQLLVNDGASGFEPSVDLPGWSEIGLASGTAIATGDLDGDGWVDVVIGRAGVVLGTTSSEWIVPAPNQLLRNDGAGGFQPAVALPGATGRTSALAMGDFDGDGWPDLIVGNDETTTNQLLRNNGAGGFETSVDLPGGSKLMVTLAIGDLDGDGFLDLVVGNIGAPNQLLTNDGAGGFELAVNLPGGSEKTYSLALGDLDGDGWLDIIIGNWANPLTLAISNGAPNLLLRNDGTGGFEAAMVLPGGNKSTESVSLSDFDGDGLLDVVLGSWGTPYRLLRNNGVGGFEPSVEFPGAGNAMFPDESFRLWGSHQVGDLNRDGRMDVVVGNPAEPNQIIFGTACPDGGAQLHGASWCFSCPDYIGRTRSSCVECPPDTLQQPGAGDQCNIEAPVRSARGPLAATPVCGARPSQGPSSTPHSCASKPMRQHGRRHAALGARLAPLLMGPRTLSTSALRAPLATTSRPLASPLALVARPVSTSQTAAAPLASRARQVATAPRPTRPAEASQPARQAPITEPPAAPRASTALCVVKARPALSLEPLTRQRARHAGPALSWRAWERASVRFAHQPPFPLLAARHARRADRATTPPTVEWASASRAPSRSAADRAVSHAPSAARATTSPTPALPAHWTC